MRNPVDLAQLFADIMNSHDANRFAERVSEDYVNHNPAVGDRVIGRYTHRDRHTGSCAGVPASGADINMRSIDIWRVENDQFVEHWDELNLLEVFQQMRAIPAPSGAER